jgi:hypothetical protein
MAIREHKQRLLIGLATCFCSIAPITGALLAEELTLKPPVELTREQDRERLMGLLGIKNLRLGPTSRNEPQPGRFGLVNYDEAKANPFPNLPPLLLSNARDQVTTPWLWWNVRRPEIVELFDREIYGRLPEQMPEVQWKVVESKKETQDGTAVTVREVVGHVDSSAYPLLSVDISLTVTIPADASGPVPIVLRFSRRPAAGQPARPRPATEGPSVESQILARGWGYAALDTNSIQEDNGGGMTRGIIGLVNQGQPRDTDDWGALRAWAWGASRAMDFFESDDAIDAKRVAVQGHSRYGKAALVAMAYDQRFATGYVSSSGEGGASLYRRNWGELVENVAATTEYHWMAGNFLKYAGPLSWDDLPVDTHQLIALCAPRPVFISGGDVGDEWVDAKGMFMAAAAAQPVWRLLGKKDMGTEDFPGLEVGVMEGDIAFRQHAEGHTDRPNWPTFLDFTARYF